MSHPDTALEHQTVGDVAAAWWISVLQDPKFDSGTPLSPATQNLTTALKIQALLSDQDFTVFGQILSRKITEALQDPENSYVVSYTGLFVAVDYHPNELLAEAAHEANFTPPSGAWPWKTRMWIKPNEIVAAHGDSAGPMVIWMQSE